MTMSSNTDLLHTVGDETMIWSPSLNRYAKASEVLANKVVLLYISSHWCRPCKSFTPILCELYQSLKGRRSEDFETLFCSLDAFECEYEHYCKTMPWWCLSFQSPVTSRVTTLYKVDRIPSLIAIDRGGCLITNDAVTRVSCDPKGLNFPWRPRTLVDLLPEYYLHSQGNGRSPTRELDDKYLLIYAGGQWCQLCQAFSNYLAKAYENLKRHRQDFEILFLSSDHDEQAFHNFFARMPFGAIPYQARAAKAAIANKFRIRRIPTLMMFGPRPNCGDRPLLNADVRCIFESGDYINLFPYHLQRFGDLNCTTHDINTTKSIVVFIEYCGDCEQEDVQETLKCASTSSGVTDDVKFFWVVQPSHFSQTLRSALNLSDLNNPTMVLLDLPDNGGYYVSRCGDISIQSVLEFLKQPGTRLQIQ